jgi:hypothetical protein
MLYLQLISPLQTANFLFKMLCNDPSMIVGKASSSHPFAYLRLTVTFTIVFAEPLRLVLSYSSVETRPFSTSSKHFPA